MNSLYIVIMISLYYVNGTVKVLYLVTLYHLVTKVLVRFSIVLCTTIKVKCQLF